MLNLIPCPKNIRISEAGRYAWRYIETIALPVNCTPSLTNAAIQFADEVRAATGRRLRFSAERNVALPAIRLQLADAPAENESYRLTAGQDGFLLQAESETGLFYAVQTLRQIFSNNSASYPELEIEDKPDFTVRGFYHDVTRGAVPTMETLYELVDKMAFYKLNQLQLYIEHTFAFARHSDVWEGSDPLTAEDILKLQDYCEARHVELVPSISTFGHMYMALRSRRKADLNELDVKGYEKPFSFYDRMRHYTLNPCDERSFEYVKDILAEFLPLFHSRYCNICCDETFDLGRGKNAPKVKDPSDIQAMYVDFLKKIIAVVKSFGKDSMFWGDIIGEQSELIKELPEGAIPLEWDYSLAAKRRDTAQLAKVAKTFYVCPGTAVWNVWLGTAFGAQQNILNYAKKGLEFGAAGVLNTNWGDWGNINLPASSWYGLVYGAAVSWNVSASEDVEAFESSLDALEFKGQGIASAWRHFSQEIHAGWGVPAYWVETSSEVDFEGNILPQINVDEMVHAIGILESCYAQFSECLAQAHPVDTLARAELLFGGEMTILMHKLEVEIVRKDKAIAKQLADEVRGMEQRFSDLWHLRNRPSEYHRVKTTLLRIAGKLDDIFISSK